MTFFSSFVQKSKLIRFCRFFCTAALCEVHDVDGRAVLLDEVLNRLVERRLLVDEVERNGPQRRADDGGGQSVDLRQALLERLGVAERRAHQQEARIREREERDLPRHAAIAVGVVVKLVEDRDVDVGVRAVAERHVRQDLGGSADGCARRDSPSASPVIKPTFSAPNARTSAKNFSFASALIGDV